MLITLLRLDQPKEFSLEGLKQICGETILWFRGQRISLATVLFYFDVNVLKITKSLIDLSTAF